MRFHPPPYATQAAYSYVDESSDDGHILSYDTDGEPILRWNPHCVDGDVLAHPAVAELRQHIERFRAHASGTGLATGMMLIGDNRYGLHWREPFEGDRLLLRIYYPYE